MKLRSRAFAVLVVFSGHLAHAQSFTLTQIFEIAKERIERIGIQDAQIGLATEKLKVLESGYYPHASFLIDYSRMQVPSGSSTSGGLSGFFNPDQYDGRLALTLTRVQGLREYFENRAATLNIHSQEDLLSNLKRSLYIELAKAYYTVLAARADLHNLELLLSAARTQEKEIKRFVDLGRSRYGDLLQQQTQVALVKTSVVQARDTIVLAEDTLRVIAALDKDAKIADDPGSPPTTLPAVEEFLGQADSRGDIRSFIKQIDAAKAQIWVARSDYFPSLSLKGNLHAFRSGILSTSYFDVGLSLDVPLFEGFKTNSNVRSRQLILTQSDLNLSQARRLAEKEIRYAYDEVRIAMDAIPELKASIHIAKKHWEQEQSDYRRKITTNLDVNLALVQLYNAQREYDKSIYRLKGAYQVLLASAGKTP